MSYVVHLLHHSKFIYRAHLPIGRREKRFQGNYITPTIVTHYLEKRKNMHF
jgi:hypothetical protein